MIDGSLAPPFISMAQTPPSRPLAPQLNSNRVPSGSHSGSPRVPVMVKRVDTPVSTSIANKSSRSPAGAT
jgi:hypothetical protein